MDYVHLLDGCNSVMLLRYKLEGGQWREAEEKRFYINNIVNVLAWPGVVRQEETKVIKQFFSLIFLSLCTVPDIVSKSCGGCSGFSVI